MSGEATPPVKRCVHCGRSFAWRKKWARDWAQVRHCSAACRSGRLPVDRQLDELVLSLLSERAPDATICPSEAARRADRSDWRALMPRVHEAVARLEAEGRVAVTRGGERVALDEVRGAYRVARAPRDLPAPRGASHSAASGSASQAASASSSARSRGSSLLASSSAKPRR